MGEQREVNKKTEDIQGRQDIPTRKIRERKVGGKEAEGLD